MDRFGGRCIRINGAAWEVLDVERWPEEHQAALKAKFPRITASTVANRKSLSGFSVQLLMQRAPHAWISLMACAVMMTMVLALLRSFR